MSKVNEQGKIIEKCQSSEIKLAKDKDWSNVAFDEAQDDCLRLIDYWDQ